VTEEPISIDTSENRQPRQSRSPLRSFWFVVLVVLICLINLVAFGLKTFSPPAKPSPIGPVVEGVLKTTAANGEVLADESQLQWASPTSGPSISLEYVPLGTQAILHLRPAQLLTHREADKSLAALGIWGVQVIARIEESTRVKLSEMQSLLVALHRDNDDWQFTLRVNLAEPWSADKLKRRVAEPSDSHRAVFLPAAGQGRILVSCPQPILDELTGRGDTPALLARDLQRLLPYTDQDRTATLLIPARFLQTEGRELFVEHGDNLSSAVDALLPDNAGAISLSVDWHDDFFCELAATVVQNAPVHRFAAEFAKQLQAAEQQLSASLTANPPREYGKAIEKRFPAMLGAMSDYTRTSFDNGIALARCYLPIQAGHNLLLASRLLLESRRGDRLGGVRETAVAPSQLSIGDRFNQVTSLSFPKETLEKAVEMLAADVQVPIQIAGRDLQLEGITKNQTFSLDLRNQPANEVLVEVLRLANPDRAAAGPTDPRQKLVYVIRNDAIIVTTRKAATERGEKLPEVFLAPSP
jgi:hypothetical protein